MPDEIFQRLADALDYLPNSFPRTQSGIEIELLKKIFSEEEASLACALNGEYRPVEVIAGSIGLSSKQTQGNLLALAKKGLIWFKKEDGALYFRLAPFIVGIYEANLEKMDHEFSHLFELYMLDAGKDIMKYDPAIHRALPAVSLAKSEWILPYDDVKAIIDKAKVFRVRDCICRVQQGLIGKGCDAPRHNCLILSLHERPPKPGDISKDEALAILDEAEQASLVHCVGNHQAELTYVCNCCGCCCGVLRGVTQAGIENSVAHANYYAVIDPDECANCGTCIDRCQVNAISEVKGVSVVDGGRCIGCGLCVTGCPENVAKLVRKPDEEIIHPPIDYVDWEQQRLQNRGLID
jgi:electron transport complex protein RnfB